MDLSKTLKEYLDELSSNSPIPGGGNVAALCGTLASSLGTMVCNLTIGKKKYADVESEMSEAKEKLTECKDKFVQLAAKDNEAFDKVMEAFKLPKETDNEKALRDKKIEEATIGAAEIPTEVISLCGEAVKFIKVVAEKGNKNSLSDAGVAALLISTAANGAYLNVLINCKSLGNQTIASEMLKRVDILLNDIVAQCNSITGDITKGLRS